MPCRIEVKMKNELIKKISDKLFQMFIVNKQSYGRQMPDGQYRLVKKPINPVVIDFMLSKKESIMTYQEMQRHR